MHINRVYILIKVEGKGLFYNRKGPQNPPGIGAPGLLRNYFLLIYKRFTK
jgi:hypothetical protein